MASIAGAAALHAALLIAPISLDAQGPPVSVSERASAAEAGQQRAAGARGQHASEGRRRGQNVRCRSLPQAAQRSPAAAILARIFGRGGQAEHSGSTCQDRDADLYERARTYEDRPVLRRRSAEDR